MKSDEVFVATKIAAEVKSYKKAVTSIDASLKPLGLDYIDMMIIHSPGHEGIKNQIKRMIVKRKDYLNNAQ